MTMDPTPDLDATVTDSGDLLVPAAALCEVIEASPGDHVKVHIVQQARKRTNMYGVFSERPIDLDVDDLAQARQEMWASFGTDADA